MKGPEPSAGVIVRSWSDGIEISVWVVPGASRSGVVGGHGDALKVRVAAPARRGEANAAVERLLGQVLGGRAVVVAGETGRAKRVSVTGDRRSIEARLRALLA